MLLITSHKESLKCWLVRPEGEKQSTKCFDCEYTDFNGSWLLRCSCAFSLSLNAKSSYTVSTCLKWNKVTLEASLGYYSRPVKGCVRFVCVCMCAPLRVCERVGLHGGYKALSLLSSAEWGRIEQQHTAIWPWRAHTHTHAHTYTHFNTHSSRKADIVQCRPSLISTKPHRCFPLITVITHGSAAVIPLASVISVSQYNSNSSLVFAWNDECYHINSSFK